jgi:hypothetical protein
MHSLEVITEAKGFASAVNAHPGFKLGMHTPSPHMPEVKHLAELQAKPGFVSTHDEPSGTPLSASGSQLS